MPVTKHDFVNGPNLRIHSKGSINANDTPEHQNYDSINPANIDLRITTRKNNISSKKKSFWSSNLSLESLNTLQSSSNISKQNLFTSGKKMLKNLIAQSPPLSAQRKKGPLTRSQTMKPIERRQIFNRASGSQHSSDINETKIDNTTTGTKGELNANSINIYDRLFVNKRFNATNIKIVKQIDDELSPYSHIYKDFAVDCLRPFFHIKNIQNLDQTTFCAQSAESSLVNNKNSDSTTDRLAISRIHQLPLSFTYSEEIFEKHNSPSISLCLSSSSSNSLVRSEENFKSLLTDDSVDLKNNFERNQLLLIDAAVLEIPKPQPRSIYLVYESHKQTNQHHESTNRIIAKEHIENIKVKNKIQDKMVVQKNHPVFEKNELIEPSSSSCSSSSSSSKLNEDNPKKIPNDALYQVETSQTNVSSSEVDKKSVAQPFQIDTNRTTNSQDYEFIRDEEQEKKRFAKGRIIDELVQTEMDYYKVMKLLYDVYLGVNSEKSIELSKKEAIFCNLHEIMNLSSVILNDFESHILNRSFEQVNIGKCFLKNVDDIKKTYSYFTQYIEYSNYVLDKNEKVVEVQKFIQNGLNIIKQQTTSAFDLHSLLLKPIQRVLKYPLLLQELIKNTEPFHEDYDNLNQALAAMQHVATYINEIKRRRELIVKYGRRDKDQISIGDKMSKLTIHSVIKKSNRISMKLSNAFGLGTSTIDEQFVKLEKKFHYYEKLIKSFNKDSLQHLANLKEFFKIQTITSESIQEYYGDYEASEILQYVRINTIVLNEIYTKNLNFTHDKVLQPLNNLLKLLEIPNKLILKRHDKLLDYECARVNFEKTKEKNLAKTVQESLYETQKNYEALNNQLLEELPDLIDKCAYIFNKCFNLYLIALRSIHEKVGSQLKNLLNTNSKSIEKKAVPHSADPTFTPTMSRKNERVSVTLDSLRRKTQELSLSKKLPNLKSLVSELGINCEYEKVSAPSITPSRSSNCVKRNQNEHVRDLLKKNFVKENIFRVKKSYTGYGVSNDLLVEVNDIVAVIKKSDPCGNTSKWFVDNGYDKGIVSADCLEAYVDVEKNTEIVSGTLEPNESALVISTDRRTDDSTSLRIGEHATNEPNRFDEIFQDDLDSECCEVSRSVGSFEEGTVYNHQYINTDSSVTCSKQSEYCRALFSFESIDETTIDVKEGENLKILQKHDDNMNEEWWLLERVVDPNVNESEEDKSLKKRKRGYVPSNYVQLIYRVEINTKTPDLTVIYNE